jgi:cytochrome b subunit of formate dehydrogenase
MSLPFAVLVALGFKSSECAPSDDRADDYPDNCDGDERAPEPQTEMVRWVIIICFCIIPTAATLLSIYFKLKYPIKTAELVMILCIFAALIYACFSFIERLFASEFVTEKNK